MHYSNPEILSQLQARLATNLFTPTELRTLSQILATNYTQISQTLTFFLQQERLKQQTLLEQLSLEERVQVNEFLEKHGFKKGKEINE